MRNILLLCAVMVLSSSFLFPSDLFAQGSTQNPANGSTQNPPSGSTQNPSGAVLINPLDESISTIPAFFKAIIEILMIFAIPFIVFFIIYAGFLYVTARGNAEGIQKAHRALLYALIGGLLILGASLLLDIITGTVNDIVK